MTPTTFLDNILSWLLRSFVICYFISLRPLEFPARNARATHSAKTSNETLLSPVCSAHTKRILFGIMFNEPTTTHAKNLNERCSLWHANTIV